MDSEQLKADWEKEVQRSFTGWDFSYLAERCASTPLPWEYRDWVNRWRTPTAMLLDMGTGGGEFLLSLGHPPECTCVTEGYAPNLQLCQEKLAPTGITVRDIASDEAIPYPDASFDLVINRHESFSPAEVRRVLRPGGHFVTQQVGGQNNLDLSRRLLPDYQPALPDHTLAVVAAKMGASGFSIIAAEESFPTVRYCDVGALVFMASILTWEFPGFSVDGCFDRLLTLQAEWEQTGVITGTEHRFLIAAQKLS